MTNSVDPDQTAPIGAVNSGSTLFASILKFVSNVRQLFTADHFSRRHFSDTFFSCHIKGKCIPVSIEQTAAALVLRFLHL